MQIMISACTRVVELGLISADISQIKPKFQDVIPFEIGPTISPFTTDVKFAAMHSFSSLVGSDHPPSQRKIRAAPAQVSPWGRRFVLDDPVAGNNVPTPTVVGYPGTGRSRPIRSSIPPSISLAINTSAIWYISLLARCTNRLPVLNSRVCGVLSVRCFIGSGKAGISKSIPIVLLVSGKVSLWRAQVVYWCSPNMGQLFAVKMEAPSRTG